MPKIFQSSIQQSKSLNPHSTVCGNCGDFISLPYTTDNTLKSLPNYPLVHLDHPLHISSPETSSGPISLDSGIEQHNSLPYKDIKNINSSRNKTPPLNESSPIESNSNSHSTSSLSFPTTKTEIEDINDDRCSKSVQTQTDWIPVKYIVIERDQAVPKICSFDDHRRAIEKKITFSNLLDKKNHQNTKLISKNSSASSATCEDDSDRVYLSDSAVETKSNTMPVGTSEYF